MERSLKVLKGNPKKYAEALENMWRQGKSATV